MMNYILKDEEKYICARSTLNYVNIYDYLDV